MNFKFGRRTLLAAERELVMQGAAVALKSEAQGEGDEAWSAANLRMQDGVPLTDLANCLRVLERHPDFRGRFKYNEVLTKVLDRGTVMLDWRINDMTAIIQERFLPGVAPDTISKALVVAANRPG